MYQMFVFNTVKTLVLKDLAKGKRNGFPLEPQNMMSEGLERKASVVFSKAQPNTKGLGMYSVKQDFLECRRWFSSATISSGPTTVQESVFDAIKKTKVKQRPVHSPFDRADVQRARTDTCLSHACLTRDPWATRL